MRNTKLQFLRKKTHKEHLKRKLAMLSWEEAKKVTGSGEVVSRKAHNLENESSNLASPIFSLGTIMDIKQQIKDVITLLDDPDWVSMKPRRKVQVIGYEIAEAVAAILNSFNPDEADAKLPEFIEAAKELYLEYVAPIDLTGRPFIERWIDKGGLEMIEPAIMKYYAWHNG